MGTLKLHKAAKGKGRGKPIPPTLPAPAPPPIVMPDLFYFIWNPYRSRPKTRHPTLESAQAEVVWLKMVCRDDEFYVYEARRIGGGS